MIKLLKRYIKKSKKNWQIKKHYKFIDKIWKSEKSKNNIILYTIKKQNLKKSEKQLKHAINKNLKKNIYTFTI